MRVKQSWREDEALTWCKSSYSAGNGGDCVEVALGWHRSSYSNDQGGQCVEIAACPHTVHVRDSKDVSRPGLTVGPEAWSSFLGFARR
ncbi:DUF397 domain-containing protein [Streptomyces sp. NPDC059740]|uniref:DUF397 domain-containing protein n=1 Tax=Streptomyces sp. NPDC059740 TaxID=3346926 RepID=UPI0036537E38